MKSLQYYLCGLLLLLAGSMQAQNGSGFDPSNPAEPTVPVFKYSLTVTVSPSGAGSASGAGSYAPGTTRTISTSANANYTFSHWTLNGERIEAARNFSYTTIEGTMNFVAVYDYTPEPVLPFTPTNPAEPSMNVKSRLYLTSDPTGICTFNRTSGDYVTPDAYVTVNVTNVNQGYEFAGWYQDGTKVADTKSFQYQAGYSDATLEAHFRELPPEPVLPFTPTSPSEPSTPTLPDGQTVDVQTKLTGDVNEDGAVDITDAVAVINVYLTGETSAVNPALADINGDGSIDITDAVAIINIYLNN